MTTETKKDWVKLYKGPLQCCLVVRKALTDAELDCIHPGFLEMGSQLGAGGSQTGTVYVVRSQSEAAKKVIDELVAKVPELFTPPAGPV